MRRFFVVQGLGGINSCRSVDKILMISRSLKVGTYKSKNIDHRGKETCACKSDKISLLHDSTISNALSFCFFLFHYNQKEKDHSRRKTSSKKKNTYMSN